MKTLIVAAVLGAGLVGVSGCANEGNEPPASDEREAIPASERQAPSLSGDRSSLLSDSPYRTLSPEAGRRPQAQVDGQPGVTGGRTTYPGLVPPTAPAGGNAVQATAGR